MQMSTDVNKVSVPLFRSFKPIYYPTNKSDILSSFWQKVAHVGNTQAATGINSLPHQWKHTMNNMADYFKRC